MQGRLMYGGPPMGCPNCREHGSVDMGDGTRVPCPAIYCEAKKRFIKIQDSMRELDMQRLAHAFAALGYAIKWWEKENTHYHYYLMWPQDIIKAATYKKCDCPGCRRVLDAVVRGPFTCLDQMDGVRHARFKKYPNK